MILFCNRSVTWFGYKKEHLREFQTGRDSPLTGRRNTFRSLGMTRSSLGQRLQRYWENSSVVRPLGWIRFAPGCGCRRAVFVDPPVQHCVEVMDSIKNVFWSQTIHWFVNQQRNSGRESQVTQHTGNSCKGKVIQLLVFVTLQMKKNQADLSMHNVSVWSSLIICSHFNRFLNKWGITRLWIPSFCAFSATYSCSWSQGERWCRAWTDRQSDVGQAFVLTSNSRS